MSPQDRARRLRQRGLSYLAIARELRISYATAYRWLNPAYVERQREVSRAWKQRNREANRARDRAYAKRPEVRGVCERCGALKGSKGRRARLCQSCIVEIKEERWAVIEIMWAEGEPRRAIAAELGWSMGHLSGQISRMRKAGWDVPLRHHPRVAA